MAVTLDQIIALLKLTVFNPVLNVAYLAYRYRHVGTLPTHEGLVKTALLGIFMSGSVWLSNRYRNGIFGAPSKLTPQQWKSEVVVVTGGGAGMGAACVQALVKKGAKVAILDIVEAKVDSPNVRAYRTDISKAESVKEVARQIEKDLGPVTMLVNNAGVNNAKLILELSDTDVDRMIDVNLKAHFWTTRAFLPGMLERKRGHIVAVSSAMGYVGISRMTDYVATKHGVVGMMESLRYELDKKYSAPYVRTTLVAIGHVRTQLFQGFDTGPVGQFMGPTIEADDMAQGVLEALEKQESRYVYLPFYVHTAPYLKILPSYLRDFIQNFSGADEAYDRGLLKK